MRLISLLIVACSQAPASCSTISGFHYATGLGSGHASTGRYLNSTLLTSTQDETSAEASSGATLDTSGSSETYSTVGNDPSITPSINSTVPPSGINMPISDVPASTSSSLSTSFPMTDENTGSLSGAAPSTTYADPSSSITSTMSTVPPSVSTQLVTAVKESTNTWLTTTRDGDTTILPVIWCPDCGGAITVWELPPVTGVVFSWAAVFPWLPKFRLLCIKIFGQPIAGDCPAPQTEGGEGSTSSGRPSTESRSQSSTTSTASCSQGMTTVSDCRVGCSVSATTLISESRISSTTVCYTTTCRTTVGCTVEATTSTSITTSSASQSQCLMMTATPYDAVASLDSAGIAIPVWMHAITFAATYDDDNTTATPTETPETSTIGTTSFASTSTNSSTLSSTMSSTLLSMTSSDTVTTSSSAITPVGSSTGFPSLSIPATSSSSASSSIPSAISSSSSTASTLTSSIAPTSTESSTVTSTSTSTSSLPPPETSTTEAPAAPSAHTIPLTIQAPVCHNEADFPGHADISKSDVKDTSSTFCGMFGDMLFSKTSKPSSGLYYSADDISYGYTDSWTPDCTTTVEIQGLAEPIGKDGPTCEEIMLDAYEKCNNGGVGVSIAAGCLVFEFTGGR